MFLVGYLNKDNYDKYSPVYLLSKNELENPEESGQVFCAPFLNDILEITKKGEEIPVCACTTDCFRQLPTDSILIGNKLYDLNDFNVEEEDPKDDEDWSLEGKASVYKVIVDKVEEEL